MTVMFQVNGHSLLGATHQHAVQILKSAGYDVVVVISRLDTTSQQPDVRSDEPSEAIVDDRPIKNNQPSLTSIFSHAKPPLSAENLLNLSEQPLTMYTDCRSALLAKLDPQQSAETSKERLTVVSSQTGLSQRPSPSGSRGTLGITRPSLSSTIQQITKADCEETDALQSLMPRQDSKPQDQVMLS